MSWRPLLRPRREPRLAKARPSPSDRLICARHRTATAPSRSECEAKILIRWSIRECRWANPLARGAVMWLTALLAACATPPADPIDRAAFEQRNDPLEPLNRRVHNANQFLDSILIRPA